MKEPKDNSNNTSHHNPEHLPVEIDAKFFNQIIPEYTFDKSLAEQSISIIEKQIDVEALKQKKSFTMGGLGFVDGGNFEKYVKLAGLVFLRGDVITKDLTAAGRASFRGTTLVKGDFNAAGSARFHDDVIVCGKSKIAGNTYFSHNLVLSEETKVGGSVSIIGHVLTDAKMMIDGRLYAKSVRSSNSIDISGILSIEEDLIVNKLNVDKIAGSIKGNLIANSIKTDRNSVIVPGNIEPDGIFGKVKQIFTNLLKGDRPKKLIIEGDLIVAQGIIDNIEIKGDVYAHSIELGDNVQISGTLHYSETLKKPETLKIETKEIEEFKHLLD